MSYRIDDIDRRILYHLVADARDTAASDIAETVDVTPATIRHRIRQLEDEGIIRGYHARVDYERSEELRTVEFTCSAPAADRQRLAQRIREVSGVVHVRELGGGQANLRVLAVGRDSDDVARIERELSGVGLAIERQAMVHDEAIQPYQPYAPDEGERSASLTDFRSLSGGAEVVEFTVSEEAPIAGRTLADANEAGLLPDEVLVVSLERGETIQAPKGDTRVQTGDVITVFAREPLSERTVEAFEPEQASESPPVES